METTKINFTKIALALLCTLAIAFGAFAFAGCGTVYRSNPGTIDEMSGTYKLTTYTQKDADDNDINQIEQLEVKAYMVIGKNGYGYYAYQDKNTELWYDSTVIEYNKEDNSDLYKSIRFTTGKGIVYIDQQKPGCGYEPVMGFNVNTKTFNYFIPNYKPTIRGIRPSYYTDVVYTKISEDTDLTKVSAELNTTLAPLPQYELKKLNGVLIFHAGMPNTSIAGDVVNEEYNKYKYYVVNFNATTQKADIYYELITGGEGAKVETNVQLDITIVQPTEENHYQNQLIIKFFGKDFTSNLGFYKSPAMYLNYEVLSEPDENGSMTQIYNNYFEKYFGSNTDIEDIVAEQLEIYNNSL